MARTLAVLSVMAEAGGSVGVTDVATALGLPMSTSHRLLDLLRGAGFVERDAAQRRYKLGLRFLRIANLVTQNTSFARLCQPALERITAQTGETALFCEYLPDHHPDPHMAAYAAKSDSPHSLRYRITLFKPAPVECAASGLAILSFLPSHIRASVCKTPRASPLTGKRLSSTALAKLIETTRRQGFAFSSGVILPDSVGIAVPIKMSEERPIGSLTLTIPLSRFVKSKLKVYVALLSEEARLLSTAQIS
ncbi:MAG: IclR family transcriptional regulator [Reyranella sp.]|nr:IclR family transcriptional regulator [Reyranella sp.]